MLSSICACIQSMLLSASARSPGLLKNYSVALTSSRAKLLVGQKPWAEALVAVEVLDVVERDVVGQEKL
jgi:hypothetical protein